MDCSVEKVINGVCRIDTSKGISTWFIMDLEQVCKFQLVNLNNKYIIFYYFYTSL